MRPTLYYLRPRSTRSRPAPFVPGSPAWPRAEGDRRPAIEVLANGNVRVNDPLYTPVWSVAEDEMTRFVTSEGPR